MSAVTALSPRLAGTSAVEALGAVKIYGTGPTAVHALDGVDVAFEAERFTAIMGPSGSGKSTLLHCVAGLDDLTEGHVYIAGRDLATLKDNELTRLRRDHVGFIFQTFNLIPTLTARENIVLPLALAGRRADAAWLDAVIDAVGIRDRLEHRPTELSGGQQQRVAAARALVTRPSVIFADEPTGNLDSRSGDELLGFLRHAVDDLGQTIVRVTHDASAAARADRVVFLRDGRVVDEMVSPDRLAVLDKIRDLGS